MSEFGGLWKRQNNPACTANVSLHNVEVGHSTKEEKEGVTGFWNAEFTELKTHSVLLRQNQFL